ncbi:MAG TPA: NUDIX hydrolase [Solirubrobacteraceae bacterium]|nr:NUDIX hydrolase [Solirubrobacteraceae bacterium]
MDLDRPAPGEQLNPGAPTAPRQAATVIVPRGAGDGLEVLLVKRNPNARFMPSAWVFPGGAVDAHEGQGDAAHRLAGVREVAEEAGVTLHGPESLVKFSRWITPRQVKIRYDTHFFLAPLPDGETPEIDGGEVVEARWYAPSGALAAWREGEIELVFPTVKHLEQLEPFDSADALLEWARGRTVEPVEPQVVLEGEVARVVLPGEPGYED